MKRIDLSGQKFNKLLVINYCKTEKNIAFWNCKCDCGRDYIAVGGSLKNGTCIRCKFCSVEARALKQREGTKDIAGFMISRIKLSAKRRNYYYEISKEYLQELLEKQDFRCALSKIPIFVGHIEKKDWKNIKWTGSLDRIDPTKGYIEGNVQWVHKDINWMKQDYTQEEFINYCKLVSENN